MIKLINYFVFVSASWSMCETVKKKNMSNGVNEEI
jgi:hypothetical protein